MPFATALVLSHSAVKSKVCLGQPCNFRLTALHCRRLPPALKAGVEALSGLDMSDVHVQANSPEPARINALAYAQGDQIHLGPGQERSEERRVGKEWKCRR